jgi:hypothetical protein
MRLSANRMHCGAAPLEGCGTVVYPVEGFRMRISRVGCLISIVISVVLSVVLTVILNLAL